MILRILALGCILTSSVGQRPKHFPSPDPDPPDAGSNPAVCLTGHMKHVQAWTDDEGSIIADTAADAECAAIDLSLRRNPAPVLKQSIELVIRKNPKKRVRYLSLARCQLTAVPQVFGFTDRLNRSLAETLQYLTLLGNLFHDFGPPGQRYDATINATDATELNLGSTQVKSTWDVGFRNIKFPKLLELDLRSCKIQHLSDRIFEGMTSLRSLYMADNKIYYISTNAFYKLNNLVHLDLSRNTAMEQKSLVSLGWESDNVFSTLPNLASLDLSQTQLSPNTMGAFQNLSRAFQRLSLCSTGVTHLRSFNFKSTTLKYLDLSGNIGSMNDPRSLDGLQDSLQVLYADSVGLKSLEGLVNFRKLEILKVSRNEISVIEPYMAETWNSLRILDIDSNRLGTWVTKLFSKIKSLEILSMRHNNINLMKPQMLQDLHNVTFLALSQNFFVCTCYNREFFEIAASNEKKTNIRHMTFHYSTTTNVTKYHIGYYDYYNKILNRNIVKRDCDEEEKFCRHKVIPEIDGTFRLFDWEPHIYDCFLIDEAITLEFPEVELCNMSQRDNMVYEVYIMAGWIKVVIIVVVAIVTLLLIVLGFVFRRCIRYCYITVKNSTTLGLMEEPKGYEDGSIFNYDVFVSYCNEDRPWVLDQLLPHIEQDCNVSVCLHERDFQVGLSILENIVSCVDRSRSIMLIISQRFLLSQWCQFEMHLAQHRLLETRREDLILILLEEIPRRVRPNTLHYLMLTKTYVLWPKDVKEQAVFWKRLKKSVVTSKLKQSDRVSLA